MIPYLCCLVLAGAVNKGQHGRRWWSAAAWAAASTNPRHFSSLLLSRCCPLVDNLAHFKCPRHAVHVPGGLPKTSTGKVQKFELRVIAKDAAKGAAKGSGHGNGAAGP